MGATRVAGATAAGGGAGAASRAATDKPCEPRSHGSLFWP